MLCDTLCYTLRDIETQAQPVDGHLPGTDPVWESSDVRPVLPGVHVTGRLSGAGPGRYYFSGALAGTAAAECRRCLGPAAVDVAEELHLVFAAAGLAEADEDDVVRIPALQAYPLCREDCLGLCPRCGADRNTEPCACAPVPDPRWAALGELPPDRR